MTLKIEQPTNDYTPPESDNPNLEGMVNPLEAEAKGFDFMRSPSLYKDKIIPYRRYMNDKRETRQLRARISPEAYHFIAKLVEKSGPEGLPYDSISEFITDAVYKWASVVWKYYFPENATARMFFHSEERLMEEMRDAEHRRKLDAVLQSVGKTIEYLLKDRQENPAVLVDIHKLLTENVGYILTFEKESPGWFTKWSRGFATHPAVINATTIFKSHPAYKDTRVVVTLEDWISRTAKYAGK